MTKDTHAIRIERGDVAVEVAGSREFVEKRFDELSDIYLEGDISAESPDQQSAPATNSSPKQAALGELYTAADIQYKRDAALLVGWYLEYVEGQDNFIKSEIEECALQAKVELGANLSRDLSTLIENGNLQEVGSRSGEKAYYLTRSGENYVTNEFGLEGYVE